MKAKQGLKQRIKPLILLGSAAGFMAVALFAAFALTDISLNTNSAKASGSGPWDEYNYGKFIEVEADLVSGSQSLSDFPVLLSFTDPDLRTVANGGEVEHANGYDILFTSRDCGTILDFEMQDYDPVTGEIVAWVKVPSLSPSVNTGFHMYYGNPDVVGNPSSSNVWTAYDVAVFHLDGNVSDASGSGNSGTNYGASVSSGILGSSYNYNGSSHYSTTGSDELATGDEFSVAVWFKADATNFAHHIWWQGESGGNGWGNPHQEMHLTLGAWTTTYDPNVLHFFMGDIGIDITDDVIHTTYPFTDTDNWHYVVVNVKDLNTKPYAEMYLDGNFLHADTGTTARTSRSAWNNNFKIASPGPSTRRFDGKIDELYISSSAKSADWIATSYTMHTIPESFITRSVQMTAEDLCRTLPVDLISFDAIVHVDGVELVWKTATELNSDYYEILRSSNGLEWSLVGQVKAAGNSNDQINYELFDDGAEIGTNYYQLRETDLDGQQSLFGPISAKFIASTSHEVNIYPNPVLDQLFIDLKDHHFNEIRICGVDGKPVFQQVLEGEGNNESIFHDFSQYPAGVYIVDFIGKDRKLQKKVIKRNF